MTVDRAPVAPAASTRSDLLLDGLFTGMIGAIIVALWFLILDVAQARPFFTPALLGTVLLHGGQVAVNGAVIAPFEIAVYTAVHFLAFIAVGYLLAYLMTLFDRFPIMFFVILVVFLGLQLGFFFLNLALGAELLGRLPLWSVIVANVLASAGMAYYQWRRHPGVLKGVERLWDDDPTT